MHAKSHKRLLVSGAALLGVSLLAAQVSGGITGTKHDLSTGTSTEKCAWCHTPHNARAATAPLWNRGVTSQTFTMYTSPTMNSIMDAQPSGSSLLCLSCHDGISATDALTGISTKHDLISYTSGSTTPNCANCHPEFLGGAKVTWTGLDLSNDHPISMIYPTPAQDPGFNTPPNVSTGWSNVPLFSGKVQCASCHNVHGTVNPKFLRMSNTGSALCLVCHNK